MSRRSEAEARLRRAWRVLRGRRLRTTGLVQSALDLPEKAPPLEAYVVAGASDAPQWVAFECPCARGHRIMLNLSTARRPRWTLTIHDSGRLTIGPSVDAHSEFGRCHFWCVDGKIKWV